MKIFLLVSVFVGPFAASVFAQRTELTDHELVSAYEGSTIRSRQIEDFDEYTGFTGMDDSGKEPTGMLLQGKVTKMLYKSPKGRAVLEIFQNYRASVEQAGAEILFICDQSQFECVKRYAGRALSDFAGLSAISNSNGRYLLARVEQDDQTAFIAIAVGPIVTDIHIVEVVKMDTGMVTVDDAGKARNRRVVLVAR